jgi:hypothetical protein
MGVAAERHIGFWLLNGLALPCCRSILQAPLVFQKAERTAVADLGPWPGRSLQEMLECKRGSHPRHAWHPPAAALSLLVFSGSTPLALPIDVRKLVMMTLFCWRLGSGTLSLV